MEPFAGAAGYAVRHADRDVVLVERDATIAALWRYLIRASADEIRALPLMPLDGTTIHDLAVCDEARSLIGFWLNKGTVSPRKSPSAWMRAGTHTRSFWGPEIRERIASQVGRIAHWQVIEGDYSASPDVEATWFIDPPYRDAGKLYRHSSRDINFQVLGEWCKRRRGQVMVCENTGADWLPFQHFMSSKSLEGARGKARSSEALWTNEAHQVVGLSAF